MNLKTFAIHQKLQNADDDLLSYVMNNKPVPIDVLERSFGSTLAPMQDNMAENLLNNPMDALNKTVPLIVTVLPNGGYDISGEIPDNIMEAVSLVHKLDDDTVIKRIVEYQLSSVYNKDCDIVDLQVDKSVQTPATNVTSTPVTKPVEDFVDEFDFADEPVEDMVDEPVEDFTEEPIEAFTDEPEEDVVDEPIEAFTDEPEEEFTEEPIEDLADEPVEDMVDEPVGDITDEPVEDEVSTHNSRAEPTEEDRQKQVTAAVRRIYERFCNDLVEYKLDERLNLNL